MPLPWTPQPTPQRAPRRHRTPRALLRGLLAALVAVPLATACTVDPVNRAGGAEDVAVHTGPMRIAMITHGDDGGFWSIVRRGAQDAAATLPEVTLDYQGSAGDAKIQSEMIKAALNQGADGLAVSAPDIGAISSALAEAEAAGVPIITLNSGSDLLETVPSVITHVGQSERVAGVGAGKRLGEAGSKTVLCILHEVNNIGLQERCAGAKEGMAESGGEVINVQVTGKADPGSTAQEIGAKMAAESPDAVLTLDPDIAMAALKEVTSREATLATFDLSPDVLDEITAGTIEFAVDQQPYLQGYLPVMFLELAVRNRNEVGANTIVATGPSFVTTENAAAIAALSDQGTR
ncbi:MAG TPA: substrate-binding domain-containing protein [Motilibacterales bacterium]|nr:substrate-binding domain-containing protein [Motilibacterales bacterium]